MKVTEMSTNLDLYLQEQNQFSNHVKKNTIKLSFFPSTLFKYYLFARLKVGPFSYIFGFKIVFFLTSLLVEGTNHKLSHTKQENSTNMIAQRGKNEPRFQARLRLLKLSSGLNRKSRSCLFVMQNMSTFFSGESARTIILWLIYAYHIENTTVPHRNAQLFFSECQNYHSTLTIRKREKCSPFELWSKIATLSAYRSLIVIVFKSLYTRVTNHCSKSF